MERLIYIGIGTLVMMILSLLAHRKYNISLWKAVVLPVLLTVSGVLGAMILAFVETGGNWGGISFYGSVLLIPILMIIVSIVLRMPYLKIMDLAAPQVCAMLAVMKMHCYDMHCCGGVYFYSNVLDRWVAFPSQIVESIVAICIMIFLLIMDRRNMFKGGLYGVFFVTYGILRFILNFFRSGIKPFVWFIPAGHLWSVISVIIGVIWLTIYFKKRGENYGDSI